VTTAEGWQLGRNQHRITASRGAKLLHDEVIDDSPMHVAIRKAVQALISETQPGQPDLATLHRITALAEFLRARQPERISRSG
jgi:hypothetical protein